MIVLSDPFIKKSDVDFLDTSGLKMATLDGGLNTSLFIIVENVINVKVKVSGNQTKELKKLRN